MSQKISVKMGGITYPITVNSEDEERLLRIAASDIDKAVNEYLKSYPDLPLEHAFALVALNARRNALRANVEYSGVKEEVDRLEKSVEEYLENIDSTAVS